MFRKMIVVALLLFVVSCGDSPEHKLYRATLAMRNGLPDQALELVDDVLASQPDDVEAMLLKAQAHIQLAQFADSKKVLDEIIKKDGELLRARAMRVVWAQRKLRSLLAVQDFATNNPLSEEFNQVISLGQGEAEWLEVNGKNKAEAEYHFGVLAVIDGDRYDVIVSHYRRSLETVELDGDEPDENKPDIKLFEQKRNERYADAEGHFFAAIDADGKHFRAASDLTRLLNARKKYSPLWDLSVKLSVQPELPSDLVERLALAVLEMPSAVRAVEERVKIGNKLLNIVSTEKRLGKSWQITAARLHIMSRDEDKAEAILLSQYEKFPNDQTIRFLLSLSHFRQKEYDEAKQILDKLSTELRNSSRVQSLYGRTLVHTKEKLLAMEPLRRALELNPGDTPARQALVALIAEDKDAAAADVSELLKHDPSNARTIALKIEFEKAKNNKEEVLATLLATETLQPLLDSHLEILVDGFTYLFELEKAEKFARMLSQRNRKDLQDQLKLVRVLMIRNKISDAKAMLGDLKKSFPDKIEVDYTLAGLHFRLKSFDRAIDAIIPILQKKPGHSDARLLMAKCYANQLVYNQAIEQIETILKDDPQHLAAHTLAWQVYRIMGEKDRATQHLLRVDETQVNEFINPVLMATIRAAQGDEEEAIDICNRAIGRGLKNPMLHELLGEFYMRAKQFGEAEGHLIALVEAKPNSLAHYQILVNFYFDQKRVGKGLAELKRLRVRNPVLVRLAEAELLIKSNRRDDAKAILAEVYPGLVRNRDKRALIIAESIVRIELSNGEYEKALAAYQPLLDAKFQTSEVKLRQIKLAMKVDNADQTLAKLDLLAANLGPEQGVLRVRLMQEYTALKKPDRALEVLNRWLTIEPNNQRLMQWKGQLLTLVGKHRQATAVLAKAVEQSPRSAGRYLDLFQAYVQAHRYPEAEATLRKMAQLDTGSKIVAMTKLGRMFLDLGLNQQATDAFAEIEVAERKNDPRVLFAMGRALVALKQDSRAKDRLNQIPRYAKQYGTAQLMLARIEQRAGDAKAAEQRLNELMKSPRWTQIVAHELLNLTIRDKRSEELVKMADRALGVENLPGETRMLWLAFRVSSESQDNNWQAVALSLNAMSKLEPEATSIVALQIVALIHLDDMESARKLYRINPALAKTSSGRILSHILGEQPMEANDNSGLSDFIEALVGGDHDAARKAVSRVKASRTIYRNDLTRLVDRVSEIQSKELIGNLALAYVANVSDMPQLCESLAAKVIKDDPTIPLAYALLADALLARKQSIDPLIKRAQENIGSSDLATFLTVRENVNKKDYKPAIMDARKLMAHEPENAHLIYLLSTLEKRVANYEESMVLLEKIWSKPGEYQLIAGNDMAYLISDHDLDRVDEAYAIARKVLAEAPNSAVFLDTLGWIEYRRGEYQSAMVHMSKSLQSLPENRDVHMHLGMLYRALSNEQWAEYHLARSGYDAKSLP